MQTEGPGWALGSSMCISRLARRPACYIRDPYDNKLWPLPVSLPFRLIGLSPSRFCLMSTTPKDFKRPAEYSQSNFQTSTTQSTHKSQCYGACSSASLASCRATSGNRSKSTSSFGNNCLGKPKVLLGVVFPSLRSFAKGQFPGPTTQFLFQPQVQGLHGPVYGSKASRACVKIGGP